MCVGVSNCRRRGLVTKVGAVECEELGSGWGFDQLLTVVLQRLGDKKVMADWRIQGWTPLPQRRRRHTWTPTIKYSVGMYWGLVLCETWVLEQPSALF